MLTVSHIFCWTQGAFIPSVKKGNEASSALTGGRPEPLPRLWVGEPLAPFVKNGEQVGGAFPRPQARQKRPGREPRNVRRGLIALQCSQPLCPAVSLVGKDQFFKGGLFENG